MAINDLVSDALTRVRNAGMRRLPVTTLVHSKSIEAVANILVEKGYLESCNVIENGVKKTIKVVLKYNDEGKTAINEIKEFLNLVDVFTRVKKILNVSKMVTELLL